MHPSSEQYAFIDREPIPREPRCHSTAFNEAAVEILLENQKERLVLQAHTHNCVHTFPNLN